MRTEQTGSGYLYNIIFWLSRIITAFIFGASFFVVLNMKYLWSETYLPFFWNIMDYGDIFNNLFLRPFGSDIGFFISNICRNSQNINLLLVLFLLIVVLGILAIKLLNKNYRYFFSVTFIVYIVAYFIFKLQILLFLAIVTPITLVLIQILNNVCPIQRIIMLVPVIGEIFCIKKIIEYICEECSENFKNISLLVIALIVSNIVCFLVHYSNISDVSSVIEEEICEVKSYQDNIIVTKDDKIVLMDAEGKDTVISNNEFTGLYDFFINDAKKEMYIYNSDKQLLILDIDTFDIKRKFDLNEYFDEEIPFDFAKFCCNDDFSKLMLVSSNKNTKFLIDLNSYEIIRKYDTSNGLFITVSNVIYNKYKECFVSSFSDASFLQEIDIERDNTNSLEVKDPVNFVEMSNRNKEIYVSFYDQGKIGVYDAETMKLKRKIKSNYTVQNITYDEELNVLIAPSYSAGYVDIFLMDGSDKLLFREIIGYSLGNACFDAKKENLYVCSPNGLYKKELDIKSLINSK